MIRLYLKMIRPHIVAGGFLAFTLGSLLAIANGGAFNPLSFLLFYSTIFFGDLSTHFSNDYFDVEQDRVARGKKFFSTDNILATNPQMLPSCKNLSISLLSISLFLASLAVIFQAAPIELLLIMILANFLGWSYSARPLRLVSRRLGEVAIALAVGFAIPAVGYLSIKGQLDGWYAFFILPFLLYGFILALSLEAPDIEGDRLGNKRTFGVVYGIRAVFRLILVLAAVISCIFLVYAIKIPFAPVSFWVIGAFATVPLVTGVVGLLVAITKKDIQNISVTIVCSLIGFNLLMIAYLIIH
jgi:1,4-dihydroxy-2-naphthoate polyprenyltransferase